MARYPTNKRRSRGGNSANSYKLKKQLKSARRTSSNNYKKAKNYKLLALAGGAAAIFSFLKK